MNNIALFGGTFNPVHVGHLMMAESIRQLFLLDRVVFVSSFVPPHKVDGDIASPEHRHRMVTLAVEDNAYFEASSVELDREGTSYSVDTISHFRNVYGANCNLYFMVGIDAFLDLPSWHDVPGIFSLCKFIVVTRPGTTSTESALSFLDDFGKIRIQWVERDKKLDLTGEPPNIYLVESIQIDISSSDIRALVKNGYSIRYLVPRHVEEYIYKNNLFLP